MYPCKHSIRFFLNTFEHFSVPCQSECTYLKQTVKQLQFSLVHNVHLMRRATRMGD